jgi:predicted butyrate kinase (DUF1464 family)
MPERETPSTDEGLGEQKSRSASVREVVAALHAVNRDLGRCMDEIDVLREAARSRALRRYLEKHRAGQGSEGDASLAEALNAGRFDSEVQMLDRLSGDLLENANALNDRLKRLEALFPVEE